MCIRDSYWAAEPFLCWLTHPARDFSFWMKKEQGVGLSHRLPTADDSQDSTKRVQWYRWDISCPISSSSRARLFQKLILKEKGTNACIYKYTLYLFISIIWNVIQLGQREHVQHQILSKIWQDKCRKSRQWSHVNFAVKVKVKRYLPIIYLITLFH